MPRKYVPKGPSEYKIVPKRGPKPETVDLGQRCLDLLADGVERRLLFERLHVTRKQVDHALRTMRQMQAAAASGEPVPQDRPRRKHRAVHQRPSAAGLPVNWKWQDEAACYGEPLELFFGHEGERAAERARREEEAKVVCAGCPARSECLDFSIGGAVPANRWEKHGLYGGLNEDERALERRRRMRIASGERGRSRDQEDAA